MLTPSPSSSDDNIVTPLLRRLRTLRVGQQAVRLALITWCAATLVWLLPLGPWTATELSLGWTAFIGAVLALAGLLLVTAQRRASRTAALPLLAAGLSPRDLSHRSAISALPRATEARFQMLGHDAADVVTVLRADGSRRYVSSSVTDVLGYQPVDLVDGDFFSLVHPDDARRVLDFYLDHVSRARTSATLEFRYRDHNGGWRYIHCIFNNLLTDPSVGGIVVTARDISAHTQFEAQLTHRALHDALTGLPNRLLLRDRLTQTLHRTEPPVARIGVLSVALDHFREVNERYGQEVGEEVLAAIAQRLLASVRPADTVARLGGDQFLILLDNTAGPREVCRTAEHVIDLVREPLPVAGQQIAVGASVGVLLGVDAGTQAEECIRRADTAMYRARGNGGGCYVVFDPAMGRSIQHFDLLADLPRALQHNRLELEYIPYVDLPTAVIAGAEATPHWRHPRRGLLPPALLLSLAAESGQLAALRRWSLRDACHRAAAWQEATAGAAPFVAINLSASEVTDSELVEEVAVALRDTGLRPASLQLEIAETAVMEHPEAAIAALHRLKALGVRVLLAGFGGGPSSLPNLHRLPINALKVDRAFLDRPEGCLESVPILRAIAALAEALDLEVSADGIESAEQLSCVHMAGYRRAQGPFLSPPLSADQVRDALRRPLDHRDRATVDEGG